LQPANVILQRSLKHAFKVQFNAWIITIIKKQIGNGQHPNVDFKMNNLKPKLCNWLHVAWMKVGEMQSMIVKGWVEKFKVFEILMQLCNNY
jgi:hypothetical protein